MSEVIPAEAAKSAKPGRNKSVELLRIVLMLMIIASHITAHGGIEYDHFGVNSALLAVFSLGNLATNVFILITGYYSLQSKFSYKKILRLIIQVTLYQIILNTVSLLCGQATFSVDFLLTTLLPIFFGKGYWFIVRYLQLYLLIPLLNYGIREIGRKMHLALIVIFGIMFSVWPFTVGVIFTVQDFQFNTLTWFVWLYALGAYLRLYGSVFYRKKKLTVALLASSSVLFAVFTIIRNYYSFQQADDLISKIIRKISRILGDKSRNALLIVVISILLLIVFQNIKVKLSDRIYPVASSVFGIYILHDNGLFKDILWKTICRTTSVQDAVWFPLYAVAIVILIFTVCCIIDRIASKYVFKPLYQKLKL